MSEVKGSLWSRVLGAFGGGVSSPEKSPGRGRVVRQHFEGADTHRLNEGAWKLAEMGDINASIEQSLPTLRNRARYLHRNDAMVSGVIETHALMTAGRNGPMLQVDLDEGGVSLGASGESPGTKFSDLVELEWRSFCERCDIQGRRHLADFLRALIVSQWTAGEYLVQHFLTKDGVVLNEIDPGRLGGVLSGYETKDGTHVVMGVERNKWGRALAYHVQEQSTSSWGQYLSGASERVGAQYMLHCFQSIYPNQVRGVPWLAPALSVCANLREFEQAVVTAAQTAARLSVMMTAKDAVDAAEYDQPVILELEAGSAVTMTPGWAAEQLDAKQPTTTYREFCDEMLRRIGRVKSIPLMLVRLDAGEHTYSSARLDAQMAQAQFASDQAWIERVFLMPLLARVVEFTALKHGYSEVPAWRARWTWNRMPHVDPAKEAAGEDLRLANGTTSMTEVLSSRGIDLEEHFKTLQRERELRALYGVEMSVGVSGGGGKSAEDEASTSKKGKRAAGG